MCAHSGFGKRTAVPEGHYSKVKCQERHQNALGATEWWLKKKKTRDATGDRRESHEVSLARKKSRSVFRTKRENKSKGEGKFKQEKKGGPIREPASAVINAR